MFTIFTMMGGDVIAQKECEPEKIDNQIVCRLKLQLKDAKSYVEKFLIIKAIEEELIDSKCGYFLGQEGDHVIFQYHPRSDSVNGIEIDRNEFSEF